jgi:hypothetical protein
MLSLLSNAVMVYRPVKRGVCVGFEAHLDPDPAIGLNP